MTDKDRGFRQRHKDYFGLHSVSSLHQSVVCANLDEPEAKGERLLQPIGVGPLATECATC